MRRGQRIEIAAQVGSQSLDLFEGRVVRRVAEDTGSGRYARDVAALTFRQSKVEQDDLAARCKFEILWLDVAMNNLRFLRVQVVKRVQQLVGPTSKPDWPETDPDFRAIISDKIIARDVLHDEKLAIAFGKMVTHARQRWMMQSAKRRASRSN